MTRALLLATLLALTAACLGGSDDPPPAGDTSTPPTATAASPAPTIEATPTEPAISEPTRTALLVDVASGVGLVLMQTDEQVASSFADDGNGVWVSLLRSNRAIRFSFGGVELERSDHSMHPYLYNRYPWRCEPVEYEPPLSSIDGELVDVPCGRFLPGGTHMLYALHFGEGEPSEYWVLDLRSASRRFLIETRFCSCDIDLSASFSPSGRFIAIPQPRLAPHGLYLADVETGDTEAVSPVFLHSEWANERDELLMGGEDGGSRILFVPSMEEVALPNSEWPSFFGDAARYVFTPRPLEYGTGPYTTSVADAATGEVVATWEGQPQRPTFGLVLGDRGVANVGITSTEEGPAALLLDAPDCEGIALRHPNVPPEGLCMERAVAAQFSPDAMTVSYVRPVARNGGRYLWDVGIIDLRSGEDRIVAQDLLSALHPTMKWNTAGSHLLIGWPGGAGTAILPPTDWDIPAR